MRNDNLTHEQRLFCIYYARDHNAVQSYQKAYNCSYINACGHASTLLKRVEIRKEVERLIGVKVESTRLQAEELVEYHMRIAFSDIGNYVEFGRKKN